MTHDAHAWIRRLLLNPEGEVLLNVACVRCGYNLRGRRRDQPCPECRTPVELSLFGVELHQSDPAFLRRLQRGVLTLIVAVLLAPLAQAAVWQLQHLLTEPLPTLPPPAQVRRAQATAALLWIPPIMLAFWAVWKITYPDPLFDPRRPTRGRRPARLAAAFAAGGFLASLLLELVFVNRHAIAALQLLVLAATILAAFQLLRHLQRIARRARRRTLVRQLRLLTFGAVLFAVFAGPAVAARLLFQAAGNNAPPRWPHGLEIAGLAAIALLTLWTLLCLASLHGAIHAAVRAASQTATRETDEPAEPDRPRRPEDAGLT